MMNWFSVGDLDPRPPRPKPSRRVRWSRFLIGSVIAGAIFFGTDGCGIGATTYLKKVCSATFCSSGQAEEQAKSSLAQSLADDQLAAQKLLGKFPRSELAGELAAKFPDEVRSEQIDGDKVTWILDLQGSGEEPSPIANTKQYFRGCFRLTSSQGVQLVTEQYDCGDQPRPDRVGYLIDEYKDTLRDCLFDVCQQKF
jgi:hypothetical protein